MLDLLKNRIIIRGSTTNLQRGVYDDSRIVVGCVNLGEKNIAGFTSQFLLVGFPDDAGEVCLVTVDPTVPNGKKLC